MDTLSFGMNLTAGKLFHKQYLIVEPIGNPRKNSTFLAADTAADNNKVVIKIMTIQTLDSWKEFELFERETQTLKNLNHQFIPKYIDFFTGEENHISYYCLVQEYIEGRNLEQKVKSGWRLTEQQSVSLLIKILKILKYLQQFTPPVIHRDINPRNIIITSKNDIFLVDFGAVQAALAYDHLGTQTVVGTVGYMPMEQIMGKSSEATDLFAAGVTLIYLLTHTDPIHIPVENMKLDFRRLITISAELGSFLDICIDPDVSKRFSNAEQAMEVISTITLNPDKQGKIKFINELPEHNSEWEDFIEDVKERDSDLFDPRYKGY